MSKTDRTPKKIAGLKLPKEIRQAPAIKALLATAAGRKLLGDALIEGAAAAAAKVIEARNAAKETAAKAKPAPAKAPRKKTPAASRRPKPVPAPAIASAPVEPPGTEPDSLEPEAPPTAQPQVEILDAAHAGDDEPVPGKPNAAE